TFGFLKKRVHSVMDPWCRTMRLSATHSRGKKKIYLLLALVWGEANGSVMLCRGSSITNGALRDAAKRCLWRWRLEHFYSIHNPEKVASVSAIIDAYAGAKEELMAAVFFFF
ncbi:hypothetical protein TcCL_ESM12369, partial [Trypanosoma cruzi]